MKMSNLLKTFSLSMIFVCLACFVGYSQTATATLSGTITDPQGAVIPGASITIRNDTTGNERTATTNSEGSFVFPLLAPGQYTLTARRDGFASVQVPHVILNVGDQKTLSISLKVGDVNAAIEVRPDEVLVSTSPAVSTTIDRNFVGNLPLNGRSFQSLILLTPGIVGTVSSGLAPGEFSVNGQRQNANYFTVDGVSANTGVSASGGGGAGSGFAFSQQAGGAIPGNTALGTTASLVSIDALEEFKIQTSSYSAEYGRQPGGQVQLVTRSGGNEFHGTAFEYLRNDAFDAKDWFANAKRLPKTPLRQNQFGGTFSGPIILPRFRESGKPFWVGRNKTFFFFSYEGQRLRIPILTTAPLVPSLRLRQVAAPALQPILNSYPLPTGPETRGLFCVQDPNSLPASSLPIITGNCGSSNQLFLVSALTGSAPFATAFSNPSSVDAYSVRIDHTVNSKLTLFGRYGYTPSNSLTRLLNQLSGSVLTNRTLTIGSTFVATTQFNNEFRFNYSSNRGKSSFMLDNFGRAVPVDQSTLFSGYSGDASPRKAFVYFGGLFPQLNSGADGDNYSRQVNIVDNVSLQIGPHQLRFGVDWRRLNPIYGPVGYVEGIQFRSQTSIINGIADLLATGDNKEARPIFQNFSAYLQDDWKLSRRFSLDLGLRWEINPAPHDANGLRPVVLTGIVRTDASGATVAPSSVPFYKTFYTAFAPRFGLAYQLNQRSGRETVLRGGFGIYYDLGSGEAGGLFIRFPFSASSAISNVPFPIAPALAQPPPYPAIGSSLANTNLNALNLNLKLPYTLEWNVSLQQSLGRQRTVTVSYVASAARRLLTTQVLNQRVPDPLSSPRPNPNFGDIYYTDNGPTSDYQSLQAQYQSRLSHGLQLLTNYTWSHAIDTVSNEFVQGTLGRGNADFDVRHNFSTAVTYDFPKLKTNKLIKVLANGWSLDSTFYARTGIPLSLSAGNYYADGGILVNARPDVIPGQPFWIKDPTAPGGQRLNPAAFQAPPPFGSLPPFFNILARQGTMGRNVVRLPGIYQVNLAIRRQFSLSERTKLQLRAEAFNAFNHPLFGNYGNSTILPASLGVAQSMLGTSMNASGSGGLNSLYQIGGPRSMQFSARLSF